jgi:hypothetical protein
MSAKEVDMAALLCQEAEKMSRKPLTRAIFM